MRFSLRRRVENDFLAACDGITTGRFRLRTPEGHVHDFGSGGPSRRWSCTTGPSSPR